MNKISSSVKQTVSSNRLRTVEVEIDLSMSAYANVARMYGHKKVAQAKEIKTLEVPILNIKEFLKYAVVLTLIAVLYLSRLLKKGKGSLLSIFAVCNHSFISFVFNFNIIRHLKEL